MTHDPGDQDLRRWFADLRERDRRAVPAFDALVARALARPVRRSLRVPRLAAAIAVLALAGAGVLLLRRPAPTFAIATWQSPTAFLLHGPGEEILRAVPGISASVVPLRIEAAPEHNQ